jgi:hypothetical protein
VLTGNNRFVRTPLKYETLFDPQLVYDQLQLPLRFFLGEVRIRSPIHFAEGGQNVNVQA